MTVNDRQKGTIRKSAYYENVEKSWRLPSIKLQIRHCQTWPLGLKYKKHRDNGVAVTIYIIVTVVQALYHRTDVSALTNETSYYIIFTASEN